MALEPGDDVVHSIHGPGRVVAVQMRDTPDGPVEYVTIEVGDMRILIPTSEVETVGVRDPISEEDAEAILELLAEDPLKDPGHSARRRRNQKRLLDGDAAALAKIVRSLQALREDRDKPLAMRDKDHLRSATAKLAGELAIALKVTEEEAASLIERATATDEAEADAEA